MIRYSTDGTNPQNKYDGSPIPNGNDGKIAGLPGQNMSYIHTNLEEVRYFLLLAQDLGFVTSQTYRDLENNCQEVSLMLNALIKSLKQK